MVCCTVGRVVSTREERESHIKKNHTMSFLTSSSALPVPKPNIKPVKYVTLSGFPSFMENASRFEHGSEPVRPRPHDSRRTIAPLVLVIWVVSGFLAIIDSLFCMGRSGDVTQKISGCVLAFLFGPVYWVYKYVMRREEGYCIPRGQLGGSRDQCVAA